jgi:ABC-type multidrug transport system fused ATPase/permease subunit
MFGVITYTRGHYTVKLGNRIIADLRRDLFDHLQRLSLHFYSKERTGSIVSRLINDIQRAGDLVHGGILLVLMDLVQTVIALCLLFSLSWKLTLACIGILPLYVLTFKVFNERVRTASDRVQSQLGKISGTVQEKLAGIALVKANDAEHRERERFYHETEEHFGRIVEQSSIAHFVGAISETLVHSGTIIVVGFGSYLALTRDNGMSTGLLIAFLGYLGLMYGPIRRFADLNIVYQTSMASLDRVFRVLDITPKITEKWRAVSHPPQLGEVRYERVKFCYHDDSDESRVSLDDEASFDRRKGAPDPHANGNGRRHRRVPGQPLGPALGARRPRPSPPSPASASPSSARPGSGKSTIVNLLPASTTSARAASSSTASTSATTASARCASRWPSCSRSRSSSAARSATTSSTAGPTPPTTRWSRPPRPPTPTSSSACCPPATTPTSASAASTSRAGSGSASRSPARSSRTPASSSSTRPPAPSTPRARPSCRRPSSGSCRAAPASSSPTA